MMNAMNNVLQDYILKLTMTFLDDISMKGCAMEDKDETMDDQGCLKFVTDHICDSERLLL